MFLQTEQDGTRSLLFSILLLKVTSEGRATLPPSLVVTLLERVGLRKPDPAIYEIALKKLHMKADECVFLDDIGSNLKSAQVLSIRCLEVINTCSEMWCRP